MAGIDERIRKLELAIARCGDATLAAAARQRLNRLYQLRAGHRD
jgi:hypothetical protein